MPEQRDGRRDTSQVSGQMDTQRLLQERVQIDCEREVHNDDVTNDRVCCDRIGAECVAFADGYSAAWEWRWTDRHTEPCGSYSGTADAIHQHAAAYG